jgi:hypothetical protein
MKKSTCSAGCGAAIDQLIVGTMKKPRSPRAGASSLDSLAVFLHFVREPDRWGPDHSSTLHCAFQFCTLGESLCGFNRAKLVGHCDVVGIVSRLIHCLGVD